MNRVIIFGGTTEGRTYAQQLILEGREAICYVTTPYGASLLPQSKVLEVRVGRLDKSDMIEVFSEEQPSKVVDATHPYAQEVTDNICKALESLNLTHLYESAIRVIDLDKDVDYDKAVIVESFEDAIEYVSDISGNILLTTGSKNLSQVENAGHLLERLYVRILPSLESVDICQKAGIPSKNIIALQGPFSVELNLAIIRQYGIEAIVTKNSGASGGFLEKVEACKQAGIPIIVVTDPNRVSGKSEKRKITAVGVSMANEATITVEARRAIRSADYLLGSPRLIEALGYLSDAIKVKTYKPEEIESYVADKQGSIVVLFSGDPGMYSGAQNINADVVIPGVSSVSYFASKLKVSYTNCAIISNHGRKADFTSEMRGHSRAFILLSGREDVAEVVNILGYKYDYFVGFNLGSYTERIIPFTINTIPEDLDPGLYILYAQMNKEE